MGKKIRVWDGTAWQDVSPSLPYTAIHSAQASMPATGVDGQVWLDTDGTLAGQDFVPLSGGTMTGNLNTPSINSGGIAGQNYFINGGMDFWQRGTTFSGANSSSINLADRWKSYDISSTSRSTDVPTGQGFQYSISFSAPIAVSYPRLQYRMPSEEAAFLAGKTVTFSFWAKNVSGTASFFAEQQVPSSPNAFDGGVNNLGGTSFASVGNFSTSWQKYTWTTTVHSTTATNGMIFHVVRDPSSASTTLVTGFKMELGNQATPFTRAGVTLAGELAACQRYFQALSWGPTYNTAIHSGHFWSSTKSLGTVHLKTTMRGTPSVVISSPSHVTVYSANGTYAVSSIGVDAQTPASFDIEFVTSSAGTAGYGTFNRITNSSGYLWISAEL